MNRLPEELLLQIWKQAYEDVEHNDAYKRAKARQWLLDMLFQSRLTISIGRRLLYGFAFLDTIPLIFSFSLALSQYAHLARLCRSLAVGPPILASPDMVHLGENSHLYFEYDTEDDKLLSSYDRPLKGKATSDDLQPEVLATLLSRLPYLLKLQIAGFPWATIYPALQTAAARDLLSTLYLRFMHIPSSVLPLLSLRYLLPRMQNLDIMELATRELSADQAAAQSKPYQDWSLADALLNVTRQPTQLSSLQSFSLNRLAFGNDQDWTWSPEKAARELLIMDHNLIDLYLCIPASYCASVAESMSRALPSVRVLELRISMFTYMVVDSWFPGLEGILQACAVLESFTLFCDPLPASIWQSLPTSLKHLFLDDSEFEEEVSGAIPLLSLAQLVQCFENTNALPALRRFTYLPNDEDLFSNLDTAIEEQESQILPRAMTVLQNWKRLKERCVNRAIDYEGSSRIAQMEEQTEKLQKALEHS